MSFLNCFGSTLAPRLPSTKLTFLGLCACALWLGCRTPSADVPLHRYEFKSAHMGTEFTIVLYAMDSRVASEAATAAFQRIDVLEDIMSDYQADSELNWLCEKPVGIPVPLSQKLWDIFLRSEHVSRISDGAFDVTVG